jgi:hypothetical protein
MNKILYRNLVLENKDLVSGNCVLNHAMSGESLVVDTIDFKIWTDTGKAKLDGDFLTADGETLVTANSLDFRCLIEEELTDFVPGDPVYYFYDNKLINKFYLQDVKRVGRYIYDFSCVSAIGILENSMHYGGMYNGTLLSTLLEEILDGITYTVDSIIGNIKIYGWLPYATKRSNLQQITIATALSIKTKSDGTLHITALSNESKGTFGESRVAVGGDVEVVTPCTAVQVTEHYFHTSEEEIILYNDSFFTEEIILFPEPVHSLVITGGTIISSGANHAVVQGNGLVNLTGKIYLHNTKKIIVGTITNTSKDNIINVESATLITSLNSYSVANKLYEVFSKPKVISNQVIHGDEKPGDVVSVVNPYTLQNESAFIKKMDISMSNLLISDAEFLANYAPSGAITGYQNRVVITSGSTWTVPEGVTEIRAVLIGGGSGGQAGYNGQSGESGGDYPKLSYHHANDEDSPELFEYNGNAGDGGEGGQAGQGGKVVDTGVLSVTPGQTFNLSIGAGGSGGSANGAAGASGGDTEFGAYSTENGEVPATGYIDMMTSEAFAVPGYKGFKGQMGVGKNNLPSGSVLNRIEQKYEGAGFTTRHRDTGFVAQIEPYMLFAWYGGSGNYSHAIAGCPGGSSYNSYGGDSQGADWSDNNGKGFLEGGAGGAGGNGGNSKNATVYGGGGFGGHGGGGGGGGGAAKNHWASPPGGGYYYDHGQGGQGGSGGAGGNGKQGCIIIYY